MMAVRNSVLPDLILSGSEEYSSQPERSIFDTPDPMVNVLMQNLGNIVSSANKRSEILDRIADSLLSSAGMGLMLS